MAVSYYGTLGALEYIARYKPDTMFTMVNEYLTKPLVDEQQVPTSVQSMALTHWLDETWWLGQNVKTAALMPELITMLRSSSVRRKREVARSPA